MMSKERGTFVNGDASISGNTAIGGNAKISGNMVVGHHLVVDGWLEAKNIKGENKGLFSSEDSLKAAYPNPTGGWIALVGDSLPANVYRAENGEWVKTGGQGGSPSIDVEAYEKDIEQFKESLEQTKESIDANANGISEIKESDTTQNENIDKLTKSLAKTNSDIVDAIALITGTSEKSDASVYPQVVLGTFTTWQAFNEKLDEIAKSTDNRYNGVLKANVNGTSVIVIQLALYLVSGLWSQAVIGTCRPNTDGSALEYAIEMNVMKRVRQNDGLHPWEIIGGVQGSSFFGVFPNKESLPVITESGYAYVYDTENNYKVYNVTNGKWTDSGSVVKLGGDTSEMSTRIAANESKIATEGERITQLEGSLTNAQTSLEESIIDLGDTTSEEIEKLKKTDSGLQTQITNIGSRTTAIETKDNEQDTQIAAVKENLQKETTRAKAEEYDIRKSTLTGLEVATDNNGIQLVVYHGLDLSPDYNDFPLAVAGKTTGIVSGAQMKKIEDGIKSNADDIKTESTRAQNKEDEIASQMNSNVSALKTRVSAVEQAINTMNGNLVLTAEATNLDDPKTYTLGEISSEKVANAAETGVGITLVVTGPIDNLGVHMKRSFFATSIHSLDVQDLSDGTNYIDFVMITGSGSGKKTFQIQLSAGQASIVVVE